MLIPGELYSYTPFGKEIICLAKGFVSKSGYIQRKLYGAPDTAKHAEFYKQFIFLCVNNIHLMDEHVSCISHVLIGEEAHTLFVIPQFDYPRIKRLT